MKRFLCLALAVAAATVAGCATSPDADPSIRVRALCAADAQIRPTVDTLLLIPGLAGQKDTAVIMAARAVIDPICANPTVPPNALAALTNATLQVALVVRDMKERRAAGVPASGAQQ